MAARGAYAVIGGAFGDEGKGLWTDALCSKLPKPLVIRHNSGAQAGHSVTLADGERHVFSHIGSGALAGAPTLLSRFFCANPSLFFQEEKRLRAHFPIIPDIFIEPEALVSSPFDMAINQMIEEARGSARHGSCGIGFGETIERAEKRPDWSIRAHDLSNPGILRGKLRMIRRHWLHERLGFLGLSLSSFPNFSFLLEEELLEAFIQDCVAFSKRLPLRSISDFPAHDLVFEGAQGLALSQDSPFFPHVTRSFTGLANALPLALQAGVSALGAIYAYRCHFTRHGAGPLPFEAKAPEVSGFKDLTNQPNPWQGSLRFAPFSVALGAGLARKDLLGTRASGLLIEPALAISCLDQAEGKPIRARLESGEETFWAPESFAQNAQSAFGMNARALLESFGPSRETARIRRLALGISPFDLLSGSF